MMNALFFIGIFFSFGLHAEKLSVRTGCPIAILVNADTGAILYEKNAYLPVNPASITKVASALYALSFFDDLDAVVTVEKDSLISMSKKVKISRGFSDPPYWLQPDGANISLRKGEKIALRDLFHAHIMCSANDAANVIALAAGRDVNTFTAGLNEHMKQIGCTSTRFFNPHGLSYPGHISTAYDFSLIARAALKNETLSKIARVVDYEIPKTNKSAPRKLRLFNRLINPKSTLYYEKAIGLKTGFNDEALFTLAAAAEHEGRMLVAILMQSPNDAQRFKDAITLFKAAFKEEKVFRQLFNAEENSFSRKVSGASRPVKAVLLEDVGVEYFPAEEIEIHAAIYWNELKMPILQGQKVGELAIESDQGELITAYPIFAEETAKPTLFYQIKRFMRSYGWYMLGTACLLLAAVAVAKRRKRFD
jgi:serine-type D-Ala-D-Ala carboxypeptidase (penicillin-binding protein 5/6)